MRISWRACAAHPAAARGWRAALGPLGLPLAARGARRGRADADVKLIGGILERRRCCLGRGLRRRGGAAQHVGSGGHGASVHLAATLPILDSRVLLGVPEWRGDYVFGAEHLVDGHIPLPEDPAWVCGSTRGAGAPCLRLAATVRQ